MTRASAARTRPAASPGVVCNSSRKIAMTRLSPRTNRAAVTWRGCPCSEMWKSAAVSVETPRPFASVTMTSMTGGWATAGPSARASATDAANAIATGSQTRTLPEHAEPDELLRTAAGADFNQVLTRRQRAECQIDVARAAAGRRVHRQFRHRIAGAVEELRRDRRVLAV